MTKHTYEARRPEYTDVVGRDVGRHRGIVYPCQCCGATLEIFDRDLWGCPKCGADYMMLRAHGYTSFLPVKHVPA